MKILIVDDSKATLEIVRRALERFEYRRFDITKLDSPLSALEKLKHWQPDIILTDWHMPDMSGLKFTETVIQKNPLVKVGMITTVDDKNKVAKAKDVGASFVLVKPFDDADLHAELLPLVRHVEEELHMPDATEDYSEGIVLPKLNQLEKLFQAKLSSDVRIHKIRPQAFDSTKVPCIAVIYEDGDIQKPRAVALMDIYAMAVIAKASIGLSDEQVKRMVYAEEIDNDVIEACQKVMESIALTFLDVHTRKNLRLKAVNVFYTSFKKLESLYDKDADKRIDFSCQFGDIAQGSITIVGF